MCFGRGLNNKINTMHESALWIVYQDKKLSFETLLKREKFLSFHIKNHTYLATEVAQVKNGHSPEIMKEVFVFQEKEVFLMRQHQVKLKKLSANSLSLNPLVLIACQLAF